MLRVPEGVVSVNTGQGFRTVATAQTLKPGDRVRAGANGAAEIAYDNGCVQAVAANQIVVVQANPTCPAAETSLGGISPVVVLGSGAAVVGGIVVIASRDDDDDPQPVSP